MTDAQTIAERLSELYVSFRGRYVCSRGEATYVPKLDGRSKRLTQRDLEEHLDGGCTISVFAGAQAAKFICFDVDDGCESTARSIVGSLVSLGFDKDAIAISDSGRKGYHVEMFFEPLMDTALLRALFQAVAGGLPHVEFRPTHTQAIKLPLGVHQATGRRCGFVDPVSFTPIDDPDFIFRIRRIPQADAERIIAFGLNMGWGRKTSGATARVRPQGADVAPVLTATGMTHTTMLRLAVSWRCGGVSEEGIVARLEDWLAEQDQRFITDTPRELARATRALARWVWSPRFHVPAAANIEFSPAEVALCLERRPHLQRMLLITALFYGKRFGSLCMGRERLSELLGSHWRGLEKAARALEADGVLATERGRPHRLAGEFVCRPMTYRVTGTAKPIDGVGGLSFRRDAAMTDVFGEMVRHCPAPKKYFTAGELAGAAA